MLAVATASQSALAPASAPSRRAVLRGAAGLLAVPSAAFAADPALVGLVPPPPRTGLTGKWLENLRIVLQDSADDVKYGGELAPGGPPTSTPAQLLLPIVQMEVALKSLAPSVADEKRWDSVIALLTSGPFETLEFKKIFNAYADNIYYESGSEEANAYLLGGATPSSSQTRQYLLRNEALKWVAEVVDELKYQKTLTDPAKRETEVASEYLDNLLKIFREYLKLAPEEELKLARGARLAVSLTSRCACACVCAPFARGWSTSKLILAAQPLRVGGRCND